MLLGIWKNVEDLEENISIDELNAILIASHEQRKNHERFAAALKGIDIDKDDNEDRMEKAKRRAAAKLAGESDEQIARTEENRELEDLGLEVEVIE